MTWLDAFLTRRFLGVNYVLVMLNGVFLGWNAYAHRPVWTVVSAIGCAICTRSIVVWKRRGEIELVIQIDGSQIAEHFAQHQRIIEQMQREDPDGTKYDTAEKRQRRYDEGEK